MSFFGPGWYPCCWISGDVYPNGVQSQSKTSALFAFFAEANGNVHSPRSTSLCDLLAAGMQLLLSPHTVAEVGCSQNTNICSVVCRICFLRYPKSKYELLHL